MNATDLPIVKIEGFLPARLGALITRNGVELCKIFWPEPTTHGRILSLIVDRKICQIEKPNPLPPVDVIEDDIEYADVRIVNVKGKVDAYLRPWAIRKIGQRKIYFRASNLSIGKSQPGEKYIYTLGPHGHFRVIEEAEASIIAGYYRMVRIDENQFLLRQLTCTQ